MVNWRNDEISPRRLLLNLLDSVDGSVLSASHAIRAGDLFSISESSVRVTLSRLVQTELLEMVERGSYRLGPAGRDLGSVVAAWRETAHAKVPWRGGWIACCVGGISRANRRSVRATDRALTIGGMRALAPGLFVRPNNLRGGVEAVRERLIRLGLDPSAIVCSLDDLDPVQTARATALWDGRSLSEAYRETAAELGLWLGSVERQEPEELARTSFLLGDAAIRQVLFDPLLPSPLVDEQAWLELIGTMESFVERGRAIWRELLGAQEG